MAHSYVSNMVHYVFSTKDRVNAIAPEIEKRLWSYMGGIAREHSMKALAVNGTENHAHILVSLPTTISIAKAIQLIKGGSSKWVHESFPTHSMFGWQEGYGAFSIGMSQLEATVAYINSQKEHHLTRTFKDEFVAILKKHGIVYDEKYVWG